jgi:hypothetical protein
MDGLEVFPRSMTGQGQGIVNPPPIDRIHHRLNESIQAYQRESRRQLSESSQVDLKLGQAIVRWLSSGDIRLEFYSTERGKEIRVRIVPTDATEISRDMSLRTFISIAPVSL